MLLARRTLRCRGNSKGAAEARAYSYVTRVKLLPWTTLQHSSRVTTSLAERLQVAAAGAPQTGMEGAPLVSTTASKVKRTPVTLNYSRRPPSLHFKVLQWNILADGLAQNGDFCKVGCARRGVRHAPHLMLHLLFDAHDTPAYSLRLLPHVCRPRLAAWSGSTGNLCYCKRSSRQTQTSYVFRNSTILVSSGPACSCLGGGRGPWWIGRAPTSLTYILHLTSRVQPLFVRDARTSAEDLRKALKELGYDGAFREKRASPALKYEYPPDGMAVFYRRDRFACDESGIEGASW